MISKGNLQNRQWLNDLYKIREKWSTAFNKDCFNLGILSTQRSESTNHVCHGFLGLEKVMRNWRRNEQDEEFRCSQTDIVPYMKSSPILKQAAKFYSRKLYAYFEEEFLHGLGELCVENTSSDLSRFSVWNIDNSNDSHNWIVNFNSLEGTIECSCVKFEMMGILCAHCMRVMR
ncbi:Protein FAR1-RELATED SEQUENCE 9 [Dendrobium catenatum]|uniref:Protein FAR1-RELATED SEQUENCE n=1 Tax=Dendrobium catenatum TaxID=906689 RepID=A0A2I0VHK0_9ASPA|nr:Protein FAR1-RELATED SEQUENCE 9 [Dendrobium catenatum]